MGFPMALLKASTQKMLYGVVVSKQIWIMNLLIYDISPDQSYSWKTSQNCLFCKDVFIFNWSPLCPLFVGSRTLQLFILITLFHPFTHQKNSTIISFKWSFSLRIYPSIHPSIHPSICMYIQYFPGLFQSHHLTLQVIYNCHNPSPQLTPQTSPSPPCEQVR